MLALGEDKCNGDHRVGTVALGCPVERSSTAYSPYGTQIFFTWVACSRNQRPSATFGSNQSIALPSLVQTCFRFPIDIAFAAATVASSPEHQMASTASCSASVFKSCDA